MPNLTESSREKHKKVEHYLQSICAYNLKFSGFFHTLKDYGKLCLLGGTLRDLVYNETPPRDIDFVFFGTLDRILTNLELQFSKNSFGGYKIWFGNKLIVDIWEASENWAFKTNLFSKSVENLHHGCFFNYDSLAMSLHTDYYEDSHFQQFKKEQKLDFISHDNEYITSNPTPALNVVKALQIREKHNIKFSDEVHDYIHDFKQQYDKSTVDQLIQAEKNHYRKNFWCRNKYNEELHKY